METDNKLKTHILHPSLIHTNQPTNHTIPFQTHATNHRRLDWILQHRRGNMGSKSSNTRTLQLQIRIYERRCNPQHKNHRTLWLRPRNSHHRTRLLSPLRWIRTTTLQPTASPPETPSQFHMPERDSGLRSKLPSRGPTRGNSTSRTQGPARKRKLQVCPHRQNHTHRNKTRNRRRHQRLRLNRHSRLSQKTERLRNIPIRHRPPNNH